MHRPGIRRRAAGLWRWSAAILLAAALIYALIEPSNARDWTPDQRVMPRGSFHGQHVDITGIRNVEYRSTDDYTVRHYDRTFDLDALRSVWFLVEPFHASVEGPAHTLVSFGFAEDTYVAISVEIRKERGERFSPLLGLLKRYELMYVVADEQDVIKLRSNYRKDDVFLYPIRTTAERRRRMFVTNIVRHVNTISAGRVPWSYKVLLPAYSDALAYDLGLIDTALPLDQARSRFRINDRAARYADAPDFSRRIRAMD